jgi:hypothetical protein
VRHVGDSAPGAQAAHDAEQPGVSSFEVYETLMPQVGGRCACGCLAGRTGVAQHTPGLLVGVRSVVAPAAGLARDASGARYDRAMTGGRRRWPCPSHGRGR